jgi:hypothetical protein
VVPKQPNIGVVDNETQWHTQYEQEDKTTHLVRHAWQSFAEKEDHPHCNRAPSDNSKDE